MVPDEYYEDYREEEIIEYRGLAMEEAGVLKILHENKGVTSIDGNHKALIDTHHETESDTRAENDADYGYLRADEFSIFRDSEGQEHALDGRVIHISKYVTFIIAKARELENLLRQKNETEDLASIDRRGQPSIDGLYEYGQRAYDSSGNKRFHWETRDEYGIYRDEHEYARAVDGIVIHVSKEDIREILERAAMHEQAHICLLEHAEKFTRTMQCQTLTAEQILMTWYMRSTEPMRCNWMIPTRGSMMSTTHSMTASKG